jgi:DNA-binding Lrp family transcriptional regulator
MDLIDKKILREIQCGFAAEKRPYKVLSSKLGVEEKEIIERVKRLKEEGFIHRLGASINSKKMGLVSTLVAMKVPSNKLSHVAQIINKHKEVTHNYSREHEFNLWFTLTTDSKKKLQTLIDDVKRETGIHQILNLPTIREFKIDVKCTNG